MTDPAIAALLANAEDAGLWLVDERDLQAFADAATPAGLAVAQVDLAGCADREAVFARFAAALRFPAWFGYNFDALADCLGDLSWWPAPGRMLLVGPVGDWRTRAPAAFATLLEVLDDAGQAWAGSGTPLWIVVALPADALADA
jgi:RNAse (barnase) inhibitor barstar